MNFNIFKQAVEAANLSVRQCSATHWQVCGGARVVNFYPYSKHGPTIYIQGTAAGIVGVTLKGVIAAANSVPKHQQLKRRATRRVEPRQRRQDKTRRKILFSRQRGLCHWCQQPVPFKQSTLDHVIPLSKGGSNGTDNLVMACHPCNAERENNVSLADLQSISARKQPVDNQGDPDDVVCETTVDTEFHDAEPQAHTHEEPPW